MRPVMTRWSWLAPVPLHCSARSFGATTRQEWQRGAGPMEGGEEDGGTGEVCQDEAAVPSALAARPVLPPELRLRGQSLRQVDGPGGREEELLPAETLVPEDARMFSP